MAGKISNLTELTDPASGDVLPIVDGSATETKKITQANLLGNLSNLTDDEIAELTNIGTTGITNTQWGYLGGLDQALSTSDNPSFVGNVGIESTNLYNKLQVQGNQTVGDATFTGSGTDDMSTVGDFSGESAVNYRVQIDSEGSPDTFKWSDDGGSTWNETGVWIYADYYHPLNNGVGVVFNSSDTHTSGDYWDFTATPGNPQLWEDENGNVAAFIGTSGSLGIGTNELAPGLNFRIEDDQASAKIKNTTSGMGSYLTLEDANDVGYQLGLWHSTGWDNGDDQFSIRDMENGFCAFSISQPQMGTTNVGINKDDPDYTLDVDGDANLTSGNVYRIAGSQIDSSDLADTSSFKGDSSITFIIDGGGSAITTGQKGHLSIPDGFTIESVRVLADQSGSIVIDIWKSSYANFPPADADSITASAPPTLSSAQKAEDTSLTGWTTAINAGDILAFNVDSASTVTRVTVALKVKRT